VGSQAAQTAGGTHSGDREGRLNLHVARALGIKRSESGIKLNDIFI
jgi:hypothetical protein